MKDAISARSHSRDGSSRFFTLGVTMVAVALCSGAHGQAIQADTWFPNGPVGAITHSFRTIYVGGAFEYWGPATGPIAALETGTGALHPGFPRITGVLHGAVADGAGGWFVVGQFDSVGDVPRANAAHILPEGSIAEWNPATQGSVSTVARGTGVIYLGGSFFGVGGQPRRNAAAVDSATGTVLPWNPNPDGEVFEIAVTDSLVYVSGSFSSIGDRYDRQLLAAVDPETGAVDDVWDPPQVGYSGPRTLAASGHTVYVGGSFTVVDSSEVRHHLIALDAETGQLASWNPSSSGSVSRLVAAPGRVYVAGSFSNIGGAPRNGFAAIDSASGLATGWNPAVTGYGASLALQDDTVYLGGQFKLAGAKPRLNLAAVDTSLGNPIDWSAAAAGQVDLLAPSGGSVLVAGSAVTSLGGRFTGSLAAMDKVTGEILPWGVPIDFQGYSFFSPVAALLLDGNILYVGGGFSTVHGAQRTGLAAIDATTGSLLPWNPRVHGGNVLALASRDDTLYVGGYFAGLGGRTRNSLGAVSKTTGLATEWNPNPNSIVQTIGIGTAGIYAGGDFEYVGTFPVISRYRLACFGYGLGTATAWDPSADSYVYGLDVSPDALYVAGDFWSVGQTARDYLAAVDPVSGIATPWNPGVDGPVTSLVRRGETIYVGGNFSTVGGETRSGLAAIDAATGAVSPWNPQTYGEVGVIDVDGDHVYLGLGPSDTPVPQIRYFAIVTGPFTVGVPNAPGERPGVPALTNGPNPFRESTLLRFALSNPDRVTLEIFDIGGRRVACLLQDQALPAGRHEKRLDARRLPCGVYVCRFTSSALSATRRLVRIE